jgi:hypothetical protein
MRSPDRQISFDGTGDARAVGWGAARAPVAKGVKAPELLPARAAAATPVAATAEVAATATTAAAATVTTAATAAVSAAAAAPAAAAATAAAFTRFADVHGPSLQLATVEHFDRLSRLAVASELDECEAAGPSGVAIEHHLDIYDVARFRENLAEVCLGDTV